jgi:hypothetical protein
MPVLLNRHGRINPAAKGGTAHGITAISTPKLIKFFSPTTTSNWTHCCGAGIGTVANSLFGPAGILQLLPKTNVLFSIG